MIFPAWKNWHDQRVPGYWLFRNTARPKKDVGESEIIGAPGSQENNQKLPGKTGSSWFLNIFGKREKEVVSFPFPQSWQMRYQKGFSPTAHRTDCSGQCAQISRPFQKAQVFFSSLHTASKMSMHYFYNQEEKNNLHFKKLAAPLPPPHFQDGNLKTHSVPLA